jgi:hypothetical protein
MSIFRFNFLLVMVQIHIIPSCIHLLSKTLYIFQNQPKISSSIAYAKMQKYTAEG